MQNSRATLSNLRNLFTTLCLFMVLLVLMFVCYSTMYNLDSTLRLSVKRRVYQPRRTESRSSESSSTRSTTTAATQRATTRDGSCRRSEMTVVSGYLNIGSFKKGAHLTYSQKDYKNWIKPLALIENPLVFYSDDAEIIAAIQQARAERKLGQCTYVQLLNRTELWAFSLLPNISYVIKQPGYPKLYPNTVIPEYAAVMHAKIDMIEHAISADRFGSQVIAWMDSGLFRDIVNHRDSILLLPAREFNKKLVTYNQIERLVPDRTLTAVFHSDWHCKSN